MSKKEEFIALLRSTERQGIDNGIEELGNIGAEQGMANFFEAPASSRFHGNYAGGLVEHSLNVYHAAMAVRDAMIKIDPTVEADLPVNSIVIASLLHDVCKGGIYKSVVKKQKNKDGYWVEVPGYDVDCSGFPLGHGEKSVILLLKWGLHLTDEEMLAIRWHMHAWDLPFQSYGIKSNFNAAKEKCPLLAVIQAADGLAAHILERDR